MIQIMIFRKFHKLKFDRNRDLTHGTCHTPSKPKGAKPLDVNSAYFPGEFLNEAHLTIIRKWSVKYEIFFLCDHLGINLRSFQKLGSFKLQFKLRKRDYVGLRPRILVKMAQCLFDLFDTTKIYEKWLIIK